MKTPCHGTSLRLNYARLTASIAKIIIPSGFVKTKIKFSEWTLRFIIPLRYVDFALDNLEHVLIDCDYHQFREFIPRSGSRVLDIGAYLGFYTVSSSLLTGSNGVVYSIEPNRYILSYLGSNLELNELNNVNIYPLAICVEPGFTKLYIGENPALSSTLREHVENYTRVIGVIDVKCIKLSTLLRYLEKVDLIKLDVEGGEIDILREAVGEFNRVGGMVIEVHRDVVDIDDLEKLLLKHGFRKIIIYIPHKLREQAILYVLR